MLTLLNKWRPENKFLKFIKYLTYIVGLLIFLSVLVLPFLGKVKATKDIFKWLWIGVTVLNFDVFFEYKKAYKEKTITPIATLFVVLILSYLHNYWNLISVLLVVIISIGFGVWEFFITIAVHRCIKFTDKMKGIALNEVAIKNFFIGIIYVTSVLMFILGLIGNNEILFYVFGCVTVILLAVSILINISQISLKKKNIVGIIFFIVDIVSLLGLIIYLIFSIEHQNLQTIILSITSALIGGILTLAGVAWTIKHSEKQKRDDEHAKAKPLFTFNIINVEEPDIANRKLCFIYDIDPSTGEYKTPNGTVSYIEFENSANSSFTIKRLYFDYSWHKPSANNTLLPNNKLLVQLYRKDIIEHPIMEIEDIYERKFYYDLMFICLPTYQNILFCSLGELKEITQQELRERNIPLND